MDNISVKKEDGSHIKPTFPFSSFKNVKVELRNEKEANDDHFNIKEVNITGEACKIKNETYECKESPKHSSYDEYTHIEGGLDSNGNIPNVINISSAPIENETDDENTIDLVESSSIDDSSSHVTFFGTYPYKYSSIDRDVVKHKRSDENATTNKIENDQEKSLEQPVQQHFTVNGSKNSFIESKLPYNITDFLQSDVQVSRRRCNKWDKKDLCLFCLQNVSNFPRHLLRKHKTEPAVETFSMMKAGSFERKKMIDILRRRGNFLGPARKEIKLVRRPSKPVSAMDVLPCIHCNGFYMKNYLHRHTKRCYFRQTLGPPLKRINTMSQAQTLLAFQGVKLDFIRELNFKEGLLNMKCDNIALVVKSEPFILSFGSFYSKRFRHCKQFYKVTKNRLRELGRLWIDMRNNVKETNFYDSLKPENFQHFLNSTKNISGYNSETKKFDNSPTLAISMGATLRLLCDHALNETKRRNETDSDTREKEIKILKELVRCNWNSEMNTAPSQKLKRKSFHEHTIMSLAEDTEKLYNYLKEKAKYLSNLLKDGSVGAFSDLLKCCYSLIFISNNLRLEELAHVELKNYYMTQSNTSDEPPKQHQQILLNKYKKIFVKGKHHKPVPVYLSILLQELIELVLKHRGDFVPSRNAYLFMMSKAETKADYCNIVKTLAKECSTKCPQAFTSNKLKKHVAIICQLLNLTVTELEELCNAIGHTVTTLQNDYGFPKKTYLIAKLTESLLELQKEDVDEDSNEQLHSEEEEEVVYERPKIPKPKKTDSNSSKGNDIRVKVKYPKIKWTEKQKEVTQEYFKKNIERKKPPIESELVIFKERYPCMDNKTWQQIKAYVYNTYKKLTIQLE